MEGLRERQELLALADRIIRRRLCARMATFVAIWVLGVGGGAVGCCYSDQRLWFVFGILVVFYTALLVEFWRMNALRDALTRIWCLVRRRS